MSTTNEVIGLLPAGGQATRISPLPCSKELYPIGFRTVGNPPTTRPKVVCHYLLEKMQLAGISKGYVIVRPGKWDIPAYLGDGSLVGMNLGYLTQGLPYGAPFTLDQAYPFVKHARVAIGFPDILFQPDDAFSRLLARQSATEADVVVGVLPFENPRKGGMVDFDEAGRVRSIIEKPEQSDSCYSWCIAVWTPAFTEFMHEYLETRLLQQLGGDRTLLEQVRQEGHQTKALPKFEIPMGDVIHAAIAHDLRVEAEILPGPGYLDIGTPNDLMRAVRDYAQPAPEQSATPVLPQTSSIPSSSN
ncbi:MULTISPECIES: sugar phosphate nucleotidyltransferase [unclassified Leptolyngbya]|uniref:nucleotidyltransferase family protein n=1 Tax=unclassified Leptolyngbya TaxID=2650499 RepID=UPI001F54CF4A|nr:MULTISPECIES: sugar phosphate nucleotidyltransferase [unclassified Leptolyngbya]